MGWGIHRHGDTLSIGYEPKYNAAGGKVFEAYFYFIGWDHVSLGIHFCWTLPNFELHLPGGFLRIGWRDDPPASEVEYWMAQ
jgi:hypothetical protein